jgi:hypothetical protein
MRDLKRAAKDGPRAFLVSLADLPHRHPFAIAGGIAGLLLVLLGLGAYSGYQANRSVSVLRPQVTQVLRTASVCNSRSLRFEKASEVCASRLRVALLNCRRHPSCLSEFEKATAGQAAPSVEGAEPGTEDPGSPPPSGADIAPDIPPDTSDPPPVGNGQPNGKSGGQDNGQGGGQQKPPSSPPPPSQGGSGDPTATEPPSPPPRAQEASQAAPKSPLTLCVDVIVPACVKAPPLLPAG